MQVDRGGVSILVVLMKLHALTPKDSFPHGLVHQPDDTAFHTYDLSRRKLKPFTLEIS